MLFVDGKEVSCLNSYMNGCLRTSCLCSVTKFFLDHVDDTGKQYYRVCNILEDNREKVK